MSAVLSLALLMAQPALKAMDRAAQLDPFIARVVKPDPKDSPLRKLQKERCRERATAVARIKEIIEIGNYSPDFYSNYGKLQMTLWENLAEVMDQPADRVKCYELRLDVLKEIERLTAIRVMAGNDPPQMLPIARANRIDAEIDLLKVKAEVEKGGKK